MFNTVICVACKSESERGNPLYAHLCGDALKWRQMEEAGILPALCPHDASVCVCVCVCVTLTPVRIGLAEVGGSGRLRRKLRYWHLIGHDGVTAPQTVLAMAAHLDKHRDRDVTHTSKHANAFLLEQIKASRTFCWFHTGLIAQSAPPLTAKRGRCNPSQTQPHNTPPFYSLHHSLCLRVHSFCSVQYIFCTVY